MLYKVLVNIPSCDHSKIVDCGESCTLTPGGVACGARVWIPVGLELAVWRTNEAAIVKARVGVVTHRHPLDVDGIAEGAVPIRACVGSIEWSDHALRAAHESVNDIVPVDVVPSGLSAVIDATDVGSVNCSRCVESDELCLS